MAREQVRRAPTLKPVAPARAATGVLLRQGERANDEWVFLSDDQLADDGADVVVSIKRLLGEGEALAQRRGRLGVLILSSEAVEEAAGYLPLLSLVAVEFPAYRDGRGFTTARLLRERYHYRGALRAVGDVLQDLIFFMLRCGFDEFVLKAKDPEAAFARAARTFSQAYQPTADGHTPVSALRRKAMIHENKAVQEKKS